MDWEETKVRLEGQWVTRFTFITDNVLRIQVTEVPSRLPRSQVWMWELTTYDFINPTAHHREERGILPLISQTLRADTAEEAKVEALADCRAYLGRMLQRIGG